MPHLAISSDDHKFVGDEGVPVKLALVPILRNVIFPFTWPVFLSRARILPLHEPTTRRSPTTVGVENTQPPVSNSQRISDKLAACRLGAEGDVGGSSKAVTNGSAAPITKNPLHKT